MTERSAKWISQANLRSCNDRRVFPSSNYEVSDTMISHRLMCVSAVSTGVLIVYASVLLVFPARTDQTGGRTNAGLVGWVQCLLRL